MNKAWLESHASVRLFPMLHGPTITPHDMTLFSCESPQAKKCGTSLSRPTREKKRKKKKKLTALQFRDSRYTESQMVVFLLVVTLQRLKAEGVTKKLFLDVETYIKLENLCPHHWHLLCQVEPFVWINFHNLLFLSFGHL